MRIIFLILSIYLISCSSQEQTSEFFSHNKVLIEKTPFEIPSFEYIRGDTVLNASSVMGQLLLKIQSLPEMTFHDLGQLKNCDCHLEGDTLKVKIYSDGGWAFRQLNLEVAQTVNGSHHFSNDIQEVTIPVNLIRLELSNLTPSPSDTIYGKILSITDTTYEDSKTMDFEGIVGMKAIEQYYGYFRCRVQAKPNR